MTQTESTGGPSAGPAVEPTVAKVHQLLCIGVCVYIAIFALYIYILCIYIYIYNLALPPAYGNSR